jgi:predicted glutamine amidotransferase
VSTRPVPAKPWLVDAEHALLRQANAEPEQLQAQGWGIAWFDLRGRLRIEKGIHGAYEPSELAHFRAAATAAKSTVTIGHIRRASNPMGLPPEKLSGLENTQPFTFESTIFAHNGMITYPLETRSYLTTFDVNVRGVNDSEVFFWLLMRQLQGERDPVAAYAQSVRALIQVWRNRGSPTSGPYSGLNVLLSRGPNELWAFCHSRGEHGNSLMDPEWPYYEMAYAAEPERVIVGSEPLDPDGLDWRYLRNGHFLHASADNGRVTTESGRIPLPQEIRVAA